MTRGTPRLPAWVWRLYRLALWCYPAEFRRRFADSMEEALADRWREKSAHGVSLWAFATRAVVSTLAYGILERATRSRAGQRTQRGQGGRTMGDALGAMVRETRLATRSLARQPGFAFVAVVTIALGLGATTAMWSLVSGVLLRPLPYPEPDRMVVVLSEEEGETFSMSFPDIRDVADRVSSVETLVGVNVTSATLTGLGDPEVIDVARLTDGLLASFSLTPALGRDLRADEFGPNGPAVAVLAYDVWVERFARDPEVLGRTFELNAVTYEVVGVAPEGFAYPEGARFWIPRRLDTTGCGRGCHTMTGLGRIAQGVTLGAVRAEVGALATSLASTYPESNLGKGFRVRSLQDSVVGEVQAGLMLMMGAVGLVLLIACSNVANLLLVRATTRSPEMAVRRALGAGRSRLVVHSLAESVVIGALGTLAGLLLAVGALRAMPLVLGGVVPRLEEVAVDGPVLLFSLGALSLSVLFFGLAPALQAATTSSRQGLEAQGERSGSGRAAGRFRTALLTGQVGLCVILLVGSGLLARSFAELNATDLGFDTDDIVRFQIALPDSRYGSLDEIRSFFRELEGDIARLSGVTSVGSVWGPPLGRGHATGTVFVQGRPEPTPERERDAAVHGVGPGYLETMGIEVLRGRGLTAGDDDPAAEPVALINEQLVREHFADEDPIGQSVRVGVSLGYPSKFYRVVGVIADVRGRAIEERSEAEMWMPHGHLGPGSMNVAVRVESDQAAIIPEVRRLVRERDADLPLHRIETVDDAVAAHVAPARFYLTLSGAFAGLAALLTAVGLYGLAAYGASRRTREIGLRVAMGAGAPQVTRMILAHAMRPTVLGLALGLGSAWVGARVLGSILYSVDPREPLPYLAAALLVVAVAALATFLPARRAARADPVQALRSG